MADDIIPLRHSYALSMVERISELEAENERLRQSIWDACIALGMDSDGNDTPRHLVFPSVADLIVREAQRARHDYDELLDELSEARRG